MTIESENKLVCLDHENYSSRIFASNHKKRQTMSSDFTDSVKKAVSVICPPINAAGWPFIFIFALVSILLSLMWEVLGLIGLCLTIWCFYFFRDPARVTPARDGLVISPACGTVQGIVPNVSLPKELDEADSSDSDYTRVSIFLSVFDVHVQRFPIAGKVKQKTYQPGAFVNAAFDKASEENERASILFETEHNGKKYEMAVVQIAGWVARRILNEASKDKQYLAGERFGIIRFGSRVDVYLPKGIEPLVSIGQRMIEGETVLADLGSTEALRIGVVR